MPFLIIILACFHVTYFLSFAWENALEKGAFRRKKCNRKNALGKETCPKKKL